MTNFRVVAIEPDEIQVAFGPIHFKVTVKQRENGSFVFLKPSSLYIQNPEYTELITLLRSAYKHRI